nr:putative peroxisomal-coenzyme a synthetase [Quercus suber]
MDKQLRSLWADVLDRSESDIQDGDNFFEIGGDSVAAIKLSGLASRRDIQLHAQEIFQSPIFSEMAQSAKKKEQSTGSVDNSPKGKSLDLMASWSIIESCLRQCNIPNHVLADILPCTSYQRELMRASHEVGAWLFQAVFEVDRNSLDRAKEVLSIIRDKNPAFRTRICQVDSGTYQVVTKDRIEWKEVHQDLEDYKAQDYSQRLCYGDALGRFAVVYDADKTYIVWTKSHAIYDRWSKMHLMEDIRDCFLDPATFKAQSHRPPYSDFVRFVESLDEDAGKKYWMSRLEGLTNYEMLGSEVKGKQFITSSTDSIRKTMDYVRPAKMKATFDAVSQVAWALTLANESKSSDVFYCAFRSCRQMAMDGVQDIIGPVWSIVPARRRLDANQSVQDILKDVEKATTSAISYEPFGMQAIEEHFGHRRCLQSAILPQPPEPESMSGTVVARDESGAEYRIRSAASLWGQTRGPFGLYFMLTPKPNNKLEFWARYDPGFLSRERVEDLQQKFMTMFGQLFTGDLDDTQISELCPHVSTSEQDAQEYESPKRSQQNGEPQPKTLTHLTDDQSKDAPAMIIPGKSALTLSHADLRHHIAELQQQFASLGIGHESAVSIALPNSLELIVAFLAATWQRGIAAPLNPAYKQDEFEFYIDDLGSAVVVIPRGAYEKDGPAVKAARKYKAAIAECFWDGSKIVLDVKEKGKLEDQGNKDVLEAKEDDVALVLHTSGTTGRPKAVPLTNANLMTSIENICRTYQLTPKDRTMLIMPLFHVHGLLASFLSPLYSGGCAIVPPRLEPSFWETFLEHKANWYTATPSMHRLILQFPPPEHIPQIRFIRSCSSQLAPALFHKLEEAFKAPVLESYAMTEASHLMCSNPLPPAKHFPGTVGQAQGVELKILDQDGNEIEQGGEGEVCIRGENVTKGYLNNPSANESSFTKERFFRTGDQGKLDKDGYLILTGRLKEMINKGGEKISPVEIDNVVSQHEAVAEAVTFAMDDEAYGQDVGCAVKLADGKEINERDLKKWIGEKISAFKVYFPDQIPKTATGKVQRKLVAEAMSKA